MSALDAEPLLCRTCDAVTPHTPLRHPRFECCVCHTIRTAAGAILYGIEATS